MRALKPSPARQPRRAPAARQSAPAPLARSLARSEASKRRWSQAGLAPSQPEGCDPAHAYAGGGPADSSGAHPWAQRGAGAAAAGGGTPAPALAACSGAASRSGGEPAGGPPASATRQSRLPESGGGGTGTGTLVARARAGRCEEGAFRPRGTTSGLVFGSPPPPPPWRPSWSSSAATTRSASA